MPSAPAPTFTVVMPAYNASATIAAAIRSVLAQTREDWELVVVDDGSTDDTAARVGAFQSDLRVRLVQQENRGLAAARNAAIAQARGRYVSMLDSDDLWMPTYLDAMGDALDREQAAAFGYTDAWVLDEGTRRIRRTTAMSRYQPNALPSDPSEFFALLLGGPNFIYGAATIRRSVLDDVGAYDERPTVHAVEDYELWLRILAHGHAAIRIPGLLAVYRDRPDSLSSRELAMHLALREVYRIVAEEYDIPDTMRERARGVMLKRERPIATLTGERRLAAAALRFRRRIGRVRRAVLRRRLWYSSPPPEVARAFPDLSQL